MDLITCIKFKASVKFGIQLRSATLFVILKLYLTYIYIYIKSKFANKTKCTINYIVEFNYLPSLDLVI